MDWDNLAKEQKGEFCKTKTCKGRVIYYTLWKAPKYLKMERKGLLSSFIWNFLKYFQLSVLFHLGMCTTTNFSFSPLILGLQTSLSFRISYRTRKLLHQGGRLRMQSLIIKDQRAFWYSYEIRTDRGKITTLSRGHPYFSNMPWLWLTAVESSGHPENKFRKSYILPGEIRNSNFSKIQFLADVGSCALIMMGMVSNVLLSNLHVRIR